MIRKLIGWVIRQKKDARFWAMAAGGVALLCLLAFFAVIEVTSQPVFCSSCHYMKKYYQEWKTSSHNKVNCLTCHTKPGVKNYLYRKMEAMHEVVSMVTGKYPPRPHAEVDDASCLRQGCHDSRLLKGKGKAEYIKGVVFDHTPHLTNERNGRNLRCTSCHAQMVMGNHMAVAGEVCFLCHFKKIASGQDTIRDSTCFTCHIMPQGETVIKGTTLTYTHADYVKPGVRCADCHGEIVSGKGDVPRVLCLSCHNEPSHYDRIDDHVFMHDNHVTRHKVECYLCHTEIRHEIARKPVSHSSGECNRCHGNGHESAELLYRGTGARGVADAPSSMYQAHINCTGCHRDRSGSLPGAPFIRSAGPAGCVACHDQDGADYLKDWKSQLIAPMAAAGTALARAEKTPGIAKNEAAAKLLADARHNISFVKAADGVHNITYAVDVLEKSTAMLEQAVKAAGAKQ